MKKRFLAMLLLIVGVQGFAAYRNASISIDSGTRYQHVAGFGGFSPSPTWQYWLGDNEMDMLFGKGDNQLGLNILRVYMANNRNYWNAGVANAKRAKRYGAFVFASPWSPPASWKSNKSEVKGGTLLESHYADWANFLNDYYKYMKSQGVNLDAVSIQNEPDWSPDYASCNWTGQQLAKFLRTQGSKIGCKVIAPESVHFTPNLHEPMLNDAEACKHLDIVGGHFYGWNGSSYPLAAQKGKEVWMTEYLVNERQEKYNANIDWKNDGFLFVKSINDAMLANMSAWVHYSLKRYYGCLGDGQHGTQNNQITKRGWILSQFAKYVAGTTRIKHSVADATGKLYSSAYITSAGDKVIVMVMNPTADTYNTTLNLPFYSKTGTVITTSESLNAKKSYFSVTTATKNPSVSVAPYSVNTYICVKSSDTSSSNQTTQPSTGSSTSTGTQGENLIKSWGNGSGFVPSGWTVADNGNQVYAGNKSMGPRIMNFSGDFQNAFYVRSVSADKAGYIEYGNANGYTLPLVFGEYELTCNVAAWKGAPYMKVEVFDPQNAVLASTIVKANGNANGKAGAYLSGTTRVSLSFYSMIKGNYRVRFTPVADAKGTGGAWVEALVGNVALYFKGNPLALNAVGQVPAGWKIVDAGEQKSAGPAGLGPRIFQFAGGDFKTGLYIRQSDASKAGYAEFGSTWGYGFSLKQGSYVFSYNAVAWAGSPYLKCEVLDESNNVLGSQIIQCTKNVNKNTNASTSGSNIGQVWFNASRTGYYHFRFTPVANSWGGSGSWLEVVVGHLKITMTSASRSISIDGGLNDGTTGIEQVEGAENISGQKTKQDSGWYTLQGQRVEHPTKGIYIHNGKKVILK